MKYFIFFATVTEEKVHSFEMFCKENDIFYKLSSDYSIVDRKQFSLDKLEKL